jgi:hypothetical protein
MFLACKKIFDASKRKRKEKKKDFQRSYTDSGRANASKKINKIRLMKHD